MSFLDTVGLISGALGIIGVSDYLRDFCANSY